MPIKLDRSRVRECIIKAPIAPWRRIDSRRVANVLGVTPQTLANWRSRSIGPQPLQPTRTQGRACYYTLDQFAVWASDMTPEDVWREWLERRGTVGGNVAGAVEFLERSGSTKSVELIPPAPVKTKNAVTVAVASSAVI